MYLFHYKKKRGRILAGTSQIILAALLHFRLQKVFRWLMMLALLIFWEPLFSQPVSVIKWPQLEKLMTMPSDTTYVINFWATWCQPCLEELPYLEALNAAHANDRVKVILVSLDFASKREEKVKPLIQKKRIQSTVLLLDEPDQNSWIDKVDASWSGAIPFTLMINNHRKRRKSFEKAFSQTELETELKAFRQ